MSLEEIWALDGFEKAGQTERAEIILAYLFASKGKSEPIFLSEVLDAFPAVHLARPKPDRIREAFRKSKRVRTISEGRYAPVRELLEAVTSQLRKEEIPADILNLDELVCPPFVGLERLADLRRMVRVYARLFLLENSMRGLVAVVLEKKLGRNWWELAASNSMKEKHEKRVANERTKKWAPARSDSGPLYSIDWSDLITLMRKFPSDFLPHVKEINFLHRYEDIGTFRNIVAHNGVIGNPDDEKLIEIYFRNWIDQIA